MRGRILWGGIKKFLGVTQGFPLSTTIFDVVVEAVVRHWILFVEGGAKDQDRRGDIFSYADDSLVASTDLV